MRRQQYPRGLGHYCTPKDQRASRESQCDGFARIEASNLQTSREILGKIGRRTAIHPLELAEGPKRQTREGGVNGSQ
jgi:hypothetical protein